MRQTKAKWILINNISAQSDADKKTSFWLVNFAEKYRFKVVLKIALQSFSIQINFLFTIFVHC